MRKIKWLAVLLVLFMFASAQSADLFNLGKIFEQSAKIPKLASIPDTNYVAIFEDYTTLVYKVVIYLNSDTDNFHSKPLYIGDANAVDGYTYAKMDAAGNIDCFFHFSADDRNTWQVTTPAGLNACSNTAKADTIGLEAGANDILFHNARWLVIEADGQASNNADVFTVIVKLTKDVAAYDALGNPIMVGKVANTSNTNP